MTHMTFRICPFFLILPPEIKRLKPYEAQVVRFSSWGTAVPKGFLTESAYFSSRRPT